MVKRIFTFVLVAALLAGCTGETDWASVPAVEIRLSDEGILVDGRVASTNESSAVYTANDIVYYEAGKDFTYGEGTEKDAHTAQEAAEHTVVHITKAGTYRLSGKLSKGQIAIDLGKKADDDPSAVVKLILNGADITCTVAPAVIFYNVYECGNKNNPQRDVDTSRAGANVILADGTENNISGSYVARIYKPDSVVLNGSEYAEKVHSFDSYWYRIPNGVHVITVEVTDGVSASSVDLKFTKENKDAIITLAVPMTASEKITVCVISIGGKIPEDADISVEVTNNANDSSPVWEDATAHALSGTNHAFSNNKQTNGWAFNFRVTVHGGDTRGYITSIQGGFQ